MHSVWQKVHQKLHPEGSSEDSYWRAAVQVHAMLQELRTVSPLKDSPADTPSWQSTKLLSFRGCWRGAFFIQ